MDKYTKKSVLGRGEYGKVFLVEEKTTKRQMAMKVIDVVDESELKNINKEVEILKKIGCSHPNIVHYEDSFYDEKKTF